MDEGQAHDQADDAEQQHVQRAVLAEALQQREVDDRADDRALDGADAAGSASGTYRYTGEGPGVIDLTASIARADGRAVWRYMPRAVSANVGEWLRTSIVAGRGYDGKMVLKGDLADFFGVGPLGFDPTEVRPNLFAMAMNTEPFGPMAIIRARPIGPHIE